MTRHDPPVPPPMRAATANARLHPPIVRHRRRRRIPAIVALALPHVALAAIIVAAFLTINHAAS